MSQIILKNADKLLKQHYRFWQTAFIDTVKR